jgi:Aromatic-ring hydroxylase, C-terminal
LHVFAWSDEAHEAGLERDAAYLVRPDGYVAVAAARDAAEKIEAFARRFALRF